MFEEIHAESVQVARRYRRCEFELLEILQKVEKNRVHYKMKYVHPDDEIKEQVQLGVRVQLIEGISEELMLKVRRVQDLLSSQKKRSVKLEEVLEAVVDGYLEKHAPVLKAERQKMRGKLQDEKAKPVVARPPGRAPIPAKTKHQVTLRDEGQCTYCDANGRCSERRFLEIHHIKPVAQGGTDELENLTLLCSGHHRMWHQVS